MRITDNYQEMALFGVLGCVSYFSAKIYETCAALEPIEKLTSETSELLSTFIPDISELKQQTKLTLITSEIALETYSKILEEDSFNFNRLALVISSVAMGILLGNYVMNIFKKPPTNNDENPPDIIIIGPIRKHTHNRHR